MKKKGRSRSAGTVRSVPKRVALYGGSFDPPHFGHVMTVTAVLNAGLADEVWLVPSGIHREKASQASIEDRKAMIAIMLATMFGSKVPVFHEPSQIDESQKISTTIELVSAMKRSFPRHKFFVVIGSDLIKELPSWHRSRELLRLTRFLVMPRPGYAIPKRLPPYLKIIPAADLALTNVSSSTVRGLIREGKSLEGIVPPAVISHIIRNRLYGYSN